MSTKESAKLHAAYLPHGYKKHNVFVRRVTLPYKAGVASYWSGGSKSYFVLYRAGQVTPVGQDPGFPAKPTLGLELMAGDVLVESGTFLGKTATACITYVDA